MLPQGLHAPRLTALLRRAHSSVMTGAAQGMKTKMRDMASKLGLGGGVNPFGQMGQ